MAIRAETCSWYLCNKQHISNHQIVVFDSWLIQLYQDLAITAKGTQSALWMSVKEERSVRLLLHRAWRNRLTWSPRRAGLSTVLGARTQNVYIFRRSLFQTFAVFWMLCAFFWVILRRLNSICWRFGPLCPFHLHRRVDEDVTDRVVRIQTQRELPRRKHTASKKFFRLTMVIVKSKMSWCPSKIINYCIIINIIIIN